MRFRFDFILKEGFNHNFFINLIFIECISMTNVVCEKMNED